MPLAGFTKLSLFFVQENSGVSLSNWQIGAINLQGNIPGRFDYIDFSKFKANGEDFRILDSDDITLIDYVIVNWDSGTKLAEIWIKIPSLLANENKILFIYGSNAGASDASSYDNAMTKIVDSTIQGLWHCDFGSGTTLFDSSVNGYDLLLLGTGGSWVGSDGGDFGGRAFAFSSGDQRLAAATSFARSVSGPSNLFPRTGNYSLQIRANYPAAITSVLVNLNLFTNIFNKNVFEFGFQSGKLSFGIRDGFERVAKRISVNQVTDGNDHQFGVSWNNGTQTIKLILDGQEIPSVDNGSSGTVVDVNPLGEFFAINGLGLGGAGNYDEIAVWQRELSEAEFAAHYFRRIFTANQPTWALVAGVTIFIEPISATVENFGLLEIHPVNRPIGKVLDRKLTQGNDNLTTDHDDLETQFVELKIFATTAQKASLETWFKTTVNGPEKSFTIIDADGNEYADLIFLNQRLNFKNKGLGTYSTVLRLKTE